MVFLKFLQTIKRYLEYFYNLKNSNAKVKSASFFCASPSEIRQQVWCVHVLANPFPRPANVAPHFCFHLRCLPLSFPFDHFTLTLEFPSSRAMRYISDPSIVQGPRCFSRAFPISRNEGTRLDVREKHFPSPTRNSFRITFRKKGGERRHIRGFWTEGKEMRVPSSLRNLHSPIFSS